jgi:hypothetical protein
MIKEDLEYIFKQQIDQGIQKLYFMLIDGDYKIIERYPVNDLAGLLPMLDCFQYNDAEADIPRFIK